MTLRFMVVEDLGPRAQGLSAIAQAMTRNPELPSARLAQEDHIWTAGDVTILDSHEFATVDALFVDFDLNTPKTPGHLTWKPIRLVSGLEVIPFTGMSTLLVARDLIESPEYDRRRKNHLSTLSPQEQHWLGPDGRTRLFSFVEATDHVSRLFTAAAAAWFGATYVNAQPNVADRYELSRAVELIGSGADEHLERDHQARVFDGEGARTLTSMLADNDYRGRAHTFIPPEHWPSNFDLYRIYLAHRGKEGFGQWKDPEGFRAAVHEVTGLVLDQRPVPQESAAPIFHRMQEGLDNFRSATDPNTDEWPAWEGLKGADPMRDYLSETSLFWRAGDVRVAYLDHLLRTGGAV